MRLRTRLRNRVHALLARQRGLEAPQVTDLFGARGRSWLATVRLPAEADQPLLEQDLEVLRLLEETITQADKLIGLAKTEDERLLESFPGIGPVFSAVIASEIDGIARFASAAKLSAYAGLVPATHASGGRVYQGRLLWACNKWLRWALVEASWTAIQRSGYFGGLYRRGGGGEKRGRVDGRAAAKARGKNSNAAIGMVAHRLCKILWCCLKERRPFSEEKPFPDRSEPQMTVAACGAQRAAASHAPRR